MTASSDRATVALDRLITAQAEAASAELELVAAISSDLTRERWSEIRDQAAERVNALVVTAEQFAATTAAADEATGDPYAGPTGDARWAACAIHVSRVDLADRLAGYGSYLTSPLVAA